MSKQSENYVRQNYESYFEKGFDKKCVNMLIKDLISEFEISKDKAISIIDKVMKEKTNEELSEELSEDDLSEQVTEYESEEESEEYESSEYESDEESSEEELKPKKSKK